MILVTGATGLVGTHLLVKLVQEQQPIRALYRSEAKKEHCRKVFSYYFSEGDTAFDQIEWVQTDLNDIPELSEAFIGITHVYHCAAKISFNPAHRLKLRKVNIDGTANIVNLCLIHKVTKLCYVSSIATLEEEPAKSTIDETAEWNPETLKSVYAITKYGAEMEVWRGTQEGLQAVVVNPGIIIGPGFFDSGSGFLFKRIYAGMRYYTTGTTGYVAITDVIDIMHTLMNGNYTNERYVVVGENLSYKEAFSMIAKALKKPVPTRKASPSLLKFAMYLQRIGNILFRTKRSIFRASIQSAFSNSNYANDKVITELNHTFTPIEKAVQETATLFLKDRR